MYLKKSYNRKTGRTQLFIVEAYRDKDKKPKAKVIKTLGYLDVLEKKYDDPISYFSCMAKQMTTERNKALETIELIINPRERMSTPARKLNFGCVALSYAYAELGMESFFTSLSQISKTEYRLNIILRNAVSICLINPSYTTYDAKNTGLMFGDLMPTVSDMRRALDLMTRHNKSMLDFICEKLRKMDILAAATRETMEDEFNRFSEEMFDVTENYEELLAYFKDDIERIRQGLDDSGLLDKVPHDFDYHKAMENLRNSIIIMRVIGFALCYVLYDRLGGRYPISRILGSIRKSEYIYVEGDVYLLEYCDGLLTELGEAIGIDFTQKFRRYDEILTLIRA